MEYRQLGNTGIKVSTLGFGCGDVGGLMVRGTPEVRLQAVKRALDLGITYFDTAPSYGNGQSEINLGAAIRQLKADVVIGTKVQIQASESGDLEYATVQSVEASLARLGRAHVDLIQLHNTIGPSRVEGNATLTPKDAIEISQIFEMLAAQGKVGAWGFTAVGDTYELLDVVASKRFHTAQSSYNLLNPSAAGSVPNRFFYHNFMDLINVASSQEMGIIAIRVLAGGAFSQTTTRHELASAAPSPIGSGGSYVDDVATVDRFAFLWKEGYVAGPIEGAIRFVISNMAVSTALVGLSSLEQLEYASQAVEKGPLPGEALERLQEIWAEFS